MIEDLGVFIDDFAQAATIDGETVYVILDKEYIEVGGVNTFAPMVTCLTADIPNAAEGTTVITGGVTYYVIGRQDDGLGMTQLVLEKA